MNRSEPPQGMATLLEQTKSSLLHTIQSSRPARRRRRLRLLGIGLAGAVCFGSVTAATAAGLFERPDAPRLSTSFISLGKAPANARVVELKLSYVCAPGGRYQFGINPSAKFPGLRGAGVRCSDDHGAHRMTQDLAFDLCEFNQEGTEFFLAVSTDLNRQVSVQSTYASGPSMQERDDPGFQDEAQLPGEPPAIAQSKKCVDHSLPIVRPKTTPSNDPWHHPALWPAPYFVNENGMTIGAWTMDTPDRELPDLVPVRGTKGEQGFQEVGKPWLILPKELEAEAKRLGQRTDAQGRTYQPLYAIDGKTRIGIVQVNR